MLGVVRRRLLVRVRDTQQRLLAEEEEIERSISERAEAKKRKDYKTSDLIRDRLLKEKKVSLVNISGFWSEMDFPGDRKKIINQAFRAPFQSK